MSAVEQTVPEGYKHTELGSIPLDWQCSYIRNIANIKVGSDVKLEHFSQEADSYYKYPVFSNTVDYPGIYGFYNFAEYTQQAVTVVGRGVGLGTAFVREKGFGAIGRLIVATPYVANAKYLAAYINEYVEVQNESSGVPQLTGIALGDKLVPLPSSEEQNAIANALSDVDALLTGLEKLIAKKQAIKTATMQQLLTGKTRLPQFATYTKGEKQGQPKGTKPSELSEIPEDWDVQTVYELAEGQKSLFDDGDWIEAEYITDKGVRLIQTGNIGVGRYQEKENKKYISESSFIKLKCKELKRGDLLICRLAEPAGRACIFPDIGEEKIITSVDVTIFRPPVETVNREYLLHYFSTNKWFSSVLEQVGGTTHKRISRGALGCIRVPMPKLAEQTAIATILSDMDTEIQSLEKRLLKTRQIKQGMMQELLTGRTRLPFDKE